MSAYSIIPFHDRAEELYTKFGNCRYIFNAFGHDDINITAYWDPEEQKALVSYNNKYAYVINKNVCNPHISIYNILDAFGCINLDAKVIQQWNANMEPVIPNDTILSLSLVETPRCLILLIPKMQLCDTLCGDGIDSDDYDSE